jgi:RNA polymerase sigma factor (sigma-70 family)
MANAAPLATNQTDADLVVASRKGDRQAFGQIVQRYQAMITGLVYAHCGNLHQSEDIAQDTFVSAWKSLSGLCDPLKLPGWLCQIARRRLADALRKKSSSEIPFSQAFDSKSEGEVAHEEPLTEEQSEFLWRTLSKIPQPYRETMVLYYRQEKSTSQVAAAMETTEEAVRQRLARGRQMLREELAASLERQLSRSAPSRGFTLRVVAALPALPGLAAQSGALGAAAAKGAGFWILLLSWLAPIGILFGLIFGTVYDVRTSQSRRQRRLAIGMGVAQFSLLAVWVVCFYFLSRIGDSMGWGISELLLAYSAATCGFGMACFGLIAWGRWRLEDALREDGSIEPPFPTVPLWGRLVSTAPVVGIFLGWMIPLANRADDRLGVWIIAGLILFQSLWLAWRLPQLQPARTIQQAFETFAMAIVFIVVLMNWRFDLWAGQSVPLGSLNVCAGVLMAWIVGIRAWDRRTRSRLR